MSHPQAAEAVLMSIAAGQRAVPGLAWFEACGFWYNLYLRSWIEARKNKGSDRANKEGKGGKPPKHKDCVKKKPGKIKGTEKEILRNKMVRGG